MLPPIPISKGGTVNAKVGDNLNVITPDVTKVTGSDPAVMDVSQPYSDGSATFNGGAAIIGEGTATLVVYGGAANKELYSVEVIATR